MRGAKESAPRPSVREPSPKRFLPPRPQTQNLRPLPDPNAHASPRTAAPPANRAGLPPLPFVAAAKAPNKGELTPRAVGPSIRSDASSHTVSGAAEILLPGERAVELGACQMHHVCEQVAPLPSPPCSPCDTRSVEFSTPSQPVRLISPG